jgi:indolepyruvate decarboxylase
MQQQTIAQYLVSRLSELGVEEFFGVPGDYNFNILEAVDENPRVRWVGCSNELNAGYAADGYARVKGISALVTTYGVGELSAINAVAGSFAESVPTVHIVGMPETSKLNDKKMLHHCLNTNYEVFKEAYSKVTNYSVVLSPHKAHEEIERALYIARNFKKPVYIAVHSDVCKLPVHANIFVKKMKFRPQKTNREELAFALAHIFEVLGKSKNTVIISEYPVLRYGLREKMQEFVEKSGLLATTMAMGKSSVDESSKSFMGTYLGHILTPETAKIVESADCVLGFGLLMSDFNTGNFSAKLDFGRVIDIQPRYVCVEGVIYKDIIMKDLLNELILICPINEHKGIFRAPVTNFGYKTENADNEYLTQDFIYSFLQKFLGENDILIAETGLSLKGSLGIKLPKGAQMFTQCLWGSIGWATPAAMGVALGAKNKRPILLTGEGAHQMSAQEVGTMLREGLSPIITVINNGGYSIERFLSKNPAAKYHDIAKWDYTKFAESFGGAILTLKARTKKEFANILTNARDLDKMVYIEAFTPKMDVCEFAKDIKYGTVDDVATNIDKLGKWLHERKEYGKYRHSAGQYKSTEA